MVRTILENLRTVIFMPSWFTCQMLESLHTITLALPACSRIVSLWTPLVLFGYYSLETRLTCRTLLLGHKAN